MPFLSAVDLLNSCFVLIFGLFLSVHIAGGWETQRQRNVIFLLCPILLLTQGLFFLIGTKVLVERLYPLITHLPIVLVLTLTLKKKLSVSIVAVLTAYLCCQLPHWMELALTDLTGSSLAAALCYTVLIIVVYVLLRRFFVHNANVVVTYSTQSLLLFGSLPLIYYIFDYMATAYSHMLPISSHVLYEFFPTILAIFYVFFLAAYHSQTQERTSAELRSSILNAELKQSLSEIEALRQAEFQTAVYQHDMRHHLNMIDGLLRAEKMDQATDYIQTIQENINSITPVVFCENETLNLLCSSFSSRSQRLGVDLKFNVTAPVSLPISDMELCSLISNSLENALHAAEFLDPSEKWVSFYCGIKQNKLCIEVKNPYAGTVVLRNGIPISSQKGHGYGCRSIKAIAEQNGGMCAFEADNGLFTLRVILPTTKR